MSVFEESYRLFISEEPLPRAPEARLASSWWRKLQRSEKRVAPSGCDNVARPVAAGCTKNGAYVADRYPCAGIPPLLRAMNPGRTSLMVREAWASIETTEPMWGAMAPVAPPGLRAIWAHDCPSWCTAAHARP